ncbi:MAG: hypothetical protein H6Q38_2627 [Chloroflexi bacterium]|nr:hypothetical protein [Chloroflexota bacterium]
MVKRVSMWLESVSTGWITLLACVIFILFISLVLPSQPSQTDEYSTGAMTPDLSFYYSADDLYRSAESYGEAGRQEYVHSRFTFDLIWPLVYTFFLAIVISWLIPRGFAAGSIWHFANLLPLAGMLMDYMENISTSIVIYRYPESTPVVDTLAAVFTMLKWITLSLSFLALGIGLLAAVWQWISRRSAKKEQ